MSAGTNASADTRGAETMTQTPTLTPEALQALREYAALMGRDWRDSLLEDWMRDDRRQWGILRTLRNTYGPTWLAGFTFPDAADEPTRTYAQTREDRRKAYLRKR
jgi:hypothetical protein